MCFYNAAMQFMNWMMVSDTFQWAGMVSTVDSQQGLQSSTPVRKFGFLCVCVSFSSEFIIFSHSAVRLFWNTKISLCVCVYVLFSLSCNRWPVLVLGWPTVTLKYEYVVVSLDKKVDEYRNSHEVQKTLKKHQKSVHVFMFYWFLQIHSVTTYG